MAGVARRLEAIRAAGFPVTLEELDAYYPTFPPWQNAADFYALAFAKQVLLTSKETAEHRLPTEKDLPKDDESLDEKTRKAVLEYIDRNAAALLLLHEAAKFKTCRYPVNFSLGPRVPISHLIAIRRSALLLRLEAMVAAEEDDPDRAAEVILSMMALGNSLIDEPVIVSQKVRILCCRLSGIALQRVMNRVVLAESQMVDLQAAFRAAEDFEAIIRGYVGARCLGIALMRQAVPLRGARRSIDLIVRRAVGLEDSETEYYLDVMAEHISVLQRPYPEQHAFAKSMDRSIRALRSPGLANLADVCALLPDYLKHVGYMRCVQAALAVERFRLANAKLPEALSDLVADLLGDIPLDPFDDKPLRYRKLEEGYVIYSVGPDGRDDGGLRQSYRDRKSGDMREDLTFTVTRGPKIAQP